MYRYAHIIALFSFIISLLFLFAAFKGYAYWYTGFVFFLWLNLGSLNYRHRTTLWLLQNKKGSFAKFFILLFIFGFAVDYFMGLEISTAWIYPNYIHFIDWVKLYLIIYPFGGLSVLELFIFLGNIFKERLQIIKRPKSTLHSLIDISNLIMDSLLILSLIIIPIFFYLQITIPYRNLFIVISILTWFALSTIQLIFHFKNGMHWVFIFLFSIFLFVLLHEFPNTFSYEWRYLNTSVIADTIPILSKRLFDIPYWVMICWYLILLFLYKIWTHIDSVYFLELAKISRKIPRKRK